MLGAADVGGLVDWVDGAAAGAGADRSLGAGAGIGKGTDCDEAAATPASQPDSNTATHTAWRIPAM